MFTSMSFLEKFSVPSVAKFRRFPGEHWRERRRVVRPEDVGLEILVNIHRKRRAAELFRSARQAQSSMFTGTTPLTNSRCPMWQGSQDFLVNIGCVYS